MEATDLNHNQTPTLPKGDPSHEQPSVSEQLQTLSLYLYLDARRFGTSQ